MNSHPKVKCLYCGESARYNRKNLKLFNHKNPNEVPCEYGGKCILHYYFQCLVYMKTHGDFLSLSDRLRTKMLTIMENDDI